MAPRAQAERRGRGGPSCATVPRAVTEKVLVLAFKVTAAAAAADHTLALPPTRQQSPGGPHEFVFLFIHAENIILILQGRQVLNYSIILGTSIM